MEELQGWWEVPTVAHFCHVFKTAFKLFSFEIEEFESALLQNDDNPYCATIEQLAMRLVKGCLARTSVTPENWEELLHKLLEKKVPRETKGEHIGDFSTPFNVLPVRKKVEILLKLCELRLDLDEDAIKNIDSSELRIEPIGTDNEKNVYFYFFGLRLYKENLPKLAELKKKKNDVSKVEAQTQKHQTQRQGTRSSKRFNGSRKSDRMKSTNNDSSLSAVSSAWSVACHTIQDWESLIEKFKNSKHNKELGQTLEKKYLPIISDLMEKRERSERKKLLEFAPRRTSSRIEKVRQQREIEQAAVEEERLQKREEARQKQAFEEKNRKIREKEERAKRAEERCLAIEERANRAQLRKFRDCYENIDDFEENSSMSSDYRSRSPVSQNGYYQKESEDGESSRNSAAISEGLQSDSVNSDKDGNEGTYDSDASNAQNDDSESSDNEKSSPKDEDSDDGKSSSNQSNSTQSNKMCDTTLSAGFRDIIYARNKDCIQYHNVQPYPSRDFQQVNTTSVEQHTARKTIRTYSKLDHQMFARTNSNNVCPAIPPVSKTIRLNFISSIPQNATIIRPVIFHP